MREELDNDLVTRFPKIFRDRRASMQRTAMCWGFEHGDGWYGLLNSTCACIQHHIDESRRARLRALQHARAMRRARAGDLSALVKFYNPGNNAAPAYQAWAEKAAREDLERNAVMAVGHACPQVVATQVKEKFGTLRFYYYGGDEYVRGVMNMAEHLSASVCEECGAPGELNDEGWLSTRCKACRKD